MWIGGVRPAGAPEDGKQAASRGYPPATINSRARRHGPFCRNASGPVRRGVGRDPGRWGNVAPNSPRPPTGARSGAGGGPIRPTLAQGFSEARSSDVRAGKRFCPSSRLGPALLAARPIASAAGDRSPGRILDPRFSVRGPERLKAPSLTDEGWFGKARPVPRPAPARGGPGGRFPGVQAAKCPKSAPNRVWAQGNRQVGRGTGFARGTGPPSRGGGGAVPPSHPRSGGELARPGAPTPRGAEGSTGFWANSGRPLPGRVPTPLRRNVAAGTGPPRVPGNTGPGRDRWGPRNRGLSGDWDLPAGPRAPGGLGGIGCPSGKASAFTPGRSGKPWGPIGLGAQFRPRGISGPGAGPPPGSPSRGSARLRPVPSGPKQACGAFGLPPKLRPIPGDPGATPADPRAPLAQVDPAPQIAGP